MRGVATRVAIEAVLVGLGVVVGKTAAWIVVGLGSLVLALEAGRRIHEWRSGRAAEPRGLSPEDRRQQLNEAQLLVAVEAEIALAREEALEMAKLLRKEWPYITFDGALSQTALPSWRAKTTDFIGTVLGAAQRAAFKASETGSDVLERLESEGRFLEGLSTGISAESIRTDEAGFLAARRERREHDAASFLDYNHYRAPGAPTPAGQPDQQNAPVPLADEFARMIDEGRALAGDVFSGSPTWGQFDSWRGKIAEFVGVALGAVEKQRLLEVKPEKGDKPRDHVLAVVAWLCQRRDKAESAPTRVRRDGFSSPETRFEQWLGDRLRAADEIERERRVGPESDSYYRDAMGKWDIENMEQLEQLRPDLLWSYRENAQTGGKEPGARVTVEDGRRVVAPGEWERYYGERIAWLRRTLRDFSAQVTAS